MEKNNIIRMPDGTYHSSICKKWLLFSTSPCVPLLSQIFLSQTPISNLTLFFIFLFLFWFVYCTYFSFIQLQHRNSLSFISQGFNAKQSRHPSQKLTFSLGESVSGATLVALLSASFIFVDPALAFKVINNSTFCSL